MVQALSYRADGPGSCWKSQAQRLPSSPYFKRNNKLRLQIFSVGHASKETLNGSSNEAQDNGRPDHHTENYVLPPLVYTAAPPGHEGFPRGSLPTRIAVQFCEDLLATNQNPRQNLATYVTTHMEEEVDQLIHRSININLADAVQYPSCVAMNDRCVKMLADLYHAPDLDKPCGTSTVGCTEATLMAGLAMKRLWQKRRKEKGLSTDNPNIIVASTAQLLRGGAKIPSYKGVPQDPSPDAVAKAIDENTIGVVAILGSTYTAELDDVKGIDAVIEEVNQQKGYGVQLTIDAAIGGFVTPFLQPELEWDFRLKNVASISTSGHKYGSVYPGVGWVIWRSWDYLPDDLVQTVSYLGTPQTSMTLNFSRNAMQVVLQYYNIIRLGYDGYKATLQTQMRTARFLAKALEDTGAPLATSVPVVAFHLSMPKGDHGEDQPRVFDEYDVMWRIREFRWMLPAYTLPNDCKHLKLLRAVIRPDITMEMVQNLAKHMKEVVDWLQAHYSTMDPEEYKQLKERFQSQDPDAQIGL